MGASVKYKVPVAVSKIEEIVVSAVTSDEAVEEAEELGYLVVGKPEEVEW